MSVTDTDLSNFFAASVGILTPYSASPTQSTITELYVDPTTHKAKVQWSKASTFNSSGNVVLGTSSHSPGDIIAIPAALTGGRDLSDLERGQLQLSCRPSAM